MYASFRVTTLTCVHLLMTNGCLSYARSESGEGIDWVRKQDFRPTS